MGRTRWDGLSRCAAVAAIAVGLLGGGAAACGDDDEAAVDEPDGAAFTTPFERAAEAAFRQAGRDREAETDAAVEQAVRDGDAEAAIHEAAQDSEAAGTGSVTVEDCPIMTPSTPSAVAEALGVDEPDRASAGGDASLTGPAGSELLACTIRIDAGTTVAITAGPVPFDRNGAVVNLFEAAETTGSELEEVDGEAPGLDADHVLALERDGEAGLYFWIDGGFHVSVSAPLDLADAEAGLRSLSVLVDEVEIALGV